MNTIDIAVIAVYFVIVMAIGFYFSRREKTSTDYFLAGRNVGWIAIGASLFATNISSEHFIGLAGTGAASGLAVGHFEWLACIIVLILGWVFTPFYLRSGVFTMPEFLEKRYNSTARMYLTTVSIIAYVLTKISVTLFAGSLLLKAVLGIDMTTSAVVLVIATGIYTIAGGLSAVIYTELMQAFVLIGGAVFLTAMGLHEVGGFAGLRAHLPLDFFSMFKPMSHPDFPWTGIVFGAPILGIWYWCTDQFIVQRVLSAKNLDQARSGTIFAGFLKILPVFILVLPGLIAAVLYPGIKGDEAYPTLVTKLLPAGIKGIVVASLLAALMSSLASCFNSSSTLFTMDFYKRLHPGVSERHLVHIGRLATVAITLLGMMWVPFMKYISAHLYIYLQSVQAYISPPIAACFLFGIFWKKANGKGAVAALFTGFVFGALRLISELINKAQGLTIAPLKWMAEINFLHFAVLLFVFCSAILIVVSLLTAAPVWEKIAGLTWAHAAEKVYATENLGLAEMTESPLRKRINIFMSLVLILTVVALWIHFF